MIIQLLFWMAALRSTQYSYSKWLMIVWKSLAFSSLPCSFSRGFPCTASRENDLTIYFWNAKHVMIDVGTLYSYHSKPRLDWELPRETKCCIKATLWSVCPMRQRSRTKFEKHRWKNALFFFTVFSMHRTGAQRHHQGWKVSCVFSCCFFFRTFQNSLRRIENKRYSWVIFESWEAFCIVLYSCNGNL